MCVLWKKIVPLEKKETILVYDLVKFFNLILSAI